LAPVKAFRRSFLNPYYLERKKHEKMGKQFSRVIYIDRDTIHQGPSLQSASNANSSKSISDQIISPLRNVLHPANQSHPKARMGILNNKLHIL
jgi:hypothetical protein